MANMTAIWMMDGYDDLPKEERDKLKYSLYGRNPWDGRHVQEIAAATYGQDHPQAQGEFLCPLKP